MKRIRAIFSGVFLLATLFAPPRTLFPAERIPAPAQVFGFEPGSEGELASLDQIQGYFRLLDSLSGAVEVETLGTTAMGHAFQLVLISSPANLARKAEILRVQQLLADPGSLGESQIDSLVSRVPAVVSVNCSIHATEVGAAQMAPVLAYELVTGRLPFSRAILDSVLILLVPVHNPDGLALVHAWFREHRGTSFEAGPLPWLYNKYTGHDNNRDWFTFTQVETKLTVEKIYNRWHPQVVLDMHQMGRYGARLFVPPYVDPVDSNVAPTLVAEMNDLGTFVQAWLTAQGYAGVVTSALFDAYTPARAYPNYHGGIRFLTEVASCRLTRPVKIPPGKLRGTVDFQPLRRSVNFPLPWPGGVWTFRDVVSYHKAAAHALLLNVARNRRTWVKNSVRVLKQQCGWKGRPAGFLIPRAQHDPSAAEDLVQILRTGQVRVYRVGAGPYRWGLFVPLAQPYGAFAKTLLEVSHYEPPVVGKQERTPYDVTTHCLPLLFGVKVQPLGQSPPLWEPAERFGAPHESFRRDTRSLWLDTRANTAYTVVNAALARGARVWRVLEGRQSGGRVWPTGSFVVSAGPLVLSELSRLADSLSVPWGVSPLAKPRGRKLSLRQAPVGLYRSWTASMDEGWTRWILEQYRFPVVTLHDQDLRAGNWSDSIRVLIVPSMSVRSILAGRDTTSVPAAYAGGLGEQGLRRLRRFVRQGGTLVLLGRAVELADTVFSRAVVDRDATKGRAYRVPGALLSGLVKKGDPATLGMPNRAALLCTTPPVLKSNEGEVLVTFARDSLLLSGWGRGVELLRGRPALVRYRDGRGSVYAFAFRPQFRAWTRGTYKLLFNLLLQYQQ